MKICLIFCVVFLLLENHQFYRIDDFFKVIKEKNILNTNQINISSVNVAHNDSIISCTAKCSLKKECQYSIMVQETCHLISTCFDGYELIDDQNSDIIIKKKNQLILNESLIGKNNKSFFFLI